MKLPAAKLLATVVCLASLFGAATASAEACCFLNWLFGPCCGSSCGPAPCGPSYYGPTGCSTGGCSTGSCGTSAYYGSFGSCSTCDSGCGLGGSCASGDCATGNCASGDCALGPASPSSSSPPPAGGGWRKKDEPRTYAPEPGNTTPGTSGERTQPESGLNGTDGRPNSLQNDDAASFLSPRTRDGRAIERTGGEELNLQKPIPVNPKPGKASPELPAIDGEGDTGTNRLPTLNLDEKIAYRPAPERKRLSARTKGVPNARLVRLPAYPKSEWTPVDTNAKVAKK